MQLKLKEIQELYESLGGLSGYEKQVGERVATVPYKLTDEVRGRITRNRRILRPFIEEMDERRLAIVKELTADDENPEGLGYIPMHDEGAQAVFGLRWRKIREEKVEVPGLLTFKREDLFVENKNPIPTVVEDGLAPVMVGALATEKETD